MSDVKYVERPFPVGNKSSYYNDYYAKVRINSFKKSDESQFFTDKGTVSEGAKLINWVAWTGYTSADGEHKKAFKVSMDFNAPEEGNYRIECLYATTEAYYTDGDTYIDGNKISPNCQWGTFGLYAKRHYDKVSLSKGVHKLTFVLGYNTIWLGTIVKHEITYEADSNNVGNLTLLSGSFKKAEMLNVDEFTFSLLYDNSFKDTLPASDINHNPSGLKIDYRDEVNFYVKTDEGKLKEVFGGYIQTVTPDDEKLTVDVTCASRMIDLDKKFSLTEMSLIGGTEDYKDKYISERTIMNVISYTRAIEILCSQIEETLETNIPAGAVQIDGEGYEDGFKMEFGEINRTTDDKKKYSIYNMSGLWLPQGVYLRNEPHQSQDQHFTFWDSSFYPSIEEKGLDLTNYPVFYIGYEMLEPKWEEEVVTATTSSTEDAVWSDASKVVYDGNNCCSSHDPQTAFEAITKGAGADCYGMTAYLYYRFNFQLGILARDVKTWGSGRSGTHHFIQIFKGGKWITPKDEYKKLSGNFGISGSTNENGTCIARAEPKTRGDINTMPPYVDCNFRGKHEGDVE